MSSPNPQIYTLRQILVDGILSPWKFLGFSVSFLPGTIVRLVRTGAYRTLFSPSRLQDSWFGDFWGLVGPEVRKNAGACVVPLLDGRTQNGRILDEVVGPAVSGTVIEVGPGSGLWVSVFSDRTAASSGSRPEDEGEGAGLRHRAPEAAGERAEITKVYGVEPNPAMHPALRQRIRAAGLEDVYEVVPVGIEELSSSGKVQKGSVDCIVSILCLCSIPDPEKNIMELYTYLKPGGRWYAYEHVKCQPWQGWWIGVYQAFVNLFWPRCIGGCQLRRDTGKTLREAGTWNKVDFAMSETEPWFNVCPHMLGVLTK